MSVPKEALPPNASKRIQDFATVNSFPIMRFEKVMETLKRGCSIRHAAACAGLANDELNIMLDWGMAGFDPWVELYEQVRMAQGNARVKMLDRLYERGMEGDMAAMEKWMKMCDQDEADLAFVDNQNNASSGGMNMTINVQKTFEPTGFAAALAPGHSDVMDAEIVEE